MAHSSRLLHPARTHRHRAGRGSSSACIVVEHVREDILGILQPLGHLGIGRLQGLVQGQRAPLSAFIHIGDLPAIRVEQDLGVVLEVDLHDLVRKSEHDRVLRLQPLFDVGAGALGLFGCLFVFLLTRIGLQVGAEVLQERHLLLQLLRILGQCMRAHHVLLFRLGDGLPLEIVEVLAIQIEHNFSRVVEKDSRCAV